MVQMIPVQRQVPKEVQCNSIFNHYLRSTAWLQQVLFFHTPIRKRGSLPQGSERGVAVSQRVLVRTAMATIEISFWSVVAFMNAVYFAN